MRSAVRASGAILVGLMFVACTAPGGPGSAKDWNWADGGTTNVTDEICTPARGSEALPARANVMSANAIPGGGDTVYTEQLFNMFASNCGQCHVQGSIGDFHVTARNFAQVVDQSVVDVIKSDNPDVFMPPLATGALPFSQRPANDPTVALVKLLEQWIAQGRPAVVFTIASEGGDDSPYLLANDVGLGMTNIGNCVPGRAMYASAAPTMDERDTFFAQLTQLPETIRETDLKSLDAAVLARSGIIAYAPQYPLWSDNAGKIRHIRVPRGKSVRFDKQKQTFEIPPNTRFYKTFLKPVIDRDGNPTFRKLETRLIVSRPDTVAPDGTVQQNALFGTYVWNEDETQARLLNLPLNNLKPFTDSVIQYTVDEPKYQMIVDSMPANLDYEIEFGNPGLKRRYAIPGSVRCVQCHMGSPTKDFVLGFFPLQVARRPSETGGSYEPSGPDEMTQLQRLIDYGVITGVDSPNDIVPLEQPQGTRPPRNDYEIKAQAYLLGNCAHCHNPRGFPSAKNPELKDALDFLPSATGGVFQFPLERTSPLRQRGLNQNIPIPYITPSLREYPVDQQDTATWTLNKWVPDCSSTRQDEDILARLLCQGQIRPTPAFVEAPWRSLLYRNVDTPFMYTDDLTIFPHMPMHTPGFDCRAPRILGDWMVSIPAARKKPSINENWMPGALDPVSGIPLPYDDSPQPYVEVPPSDTTRYPDAVAAADRRLSAYHKSIRYGFCPDNSEIVDPAVVIAGGDLPIIPVADNVWDPKDPTKLLQPNLGIPIRPHWVVTDITDPPGDWFPRQSLWKSILVDGVVDTGDLPPDPGARAEEIRSRAAVKEALEKATITDELRRFALTEMAYGLWEKKPGCNFTAIPKVSSIPVEARPRWMKIMPPAADAVGLHAEPRRRGVQEHLHQLPRTEGGCAGPARRCDHEHDRRHRPGGQLPRRAVWPGGEPRPQPRPGLRRTCDQRRGGGAPVRPLLVLDGAGRDAQEDPRTSAEPGGDHAHTGRCTQRHQGHHKRLAQHAAPGARAVRARPSCQPRREQHQVGRILLQVRDVGLGRRDRPHREQRRRRDVAASVLDRKPRHRSSSVCGRLATGRRRELAEDRLGAVALLGGRLPGGRARSRSPRPKGDGHQSRQPVAALHSQTHRSATPRDCRPVHRRQPGRRTRR